MPPLTLTPITKRPQSIPAGFKWCPTHDNKQGAILPVKQFNKHSKRKGGLYWCCRACDAQNRSREISPNSRYRQIRQRARVRKMDFDLSFARYQEIVSQLCAYGSHSPKPVKHIGIDRKDNKQGYVEGNCLPCCYRHNYIKGSVFSYDEMRDICNRYPNAKACGDPPQYKTDKRTLARKTITQSD
jgi:hypothetical protein